MKKAVLSVELVSKTNLDINYKAEFQYEPDIVLDDFTPLYSVRKWFMSADQYDQVPQKIPLHGMITFLMYGIWKMPQDILAKFLDVISKRFHEEDVRPMGRTARGVRGIDLDEGDQVVSLDIVDASAQLLTVSEFGYGKRTDAEEYRSQSRGGKGIITMKTTDRNGKVVTALQARAKDQLMIVTSGGKLIRINVEEISVVGRNTQGVRLISLDEGERVTSVTRVSDEDEVENAG